MPGSVPQQQQKQSAHVPFPMADLPRPPTPQEGIFIMYVDPAWRVQLEFRLFQIVRVQVRHSIMHIITDGTDVPAFELSYQQTCNSHHNVACEMPPAL